MTKWLIALAKVVVAASLVASLGWAIATLASRPLDGVEGDVLFEADRMRAGLRLYTNPAEGVFDYGPVPARFLVLYPPLWSALLSITGASAIFARIAGTLSWFGLLAWIAWRAAYRRQAIWVAVFIAGISTLALFGASGRPDSIAVLAAGIAVERATKHKRIDLLAGILFAIAAFVKPNVVGAAPGLFLFAIIGKRPFVRGLIGLIGGVGIIVAVLSLGVGREWVTHLLLSTAQPPSAHQLFDQLASRAPFFALPFVVAIYTSRKDPLAFGALLSSVAWCVMSLAKIGSASNYLMEPCVCLLVVFARARAPRLTMPTAALLLAQVLWVDVASTRSAVERTGEAFGRREVAPARSVQDAQESSSPTSRASSACVERPHRADAFSDDPFGVGFSSRSAGWVTSRGPRFRVSSCRTICSSARWKRSTATTTASLHPMRRFLKGQFTLAKAEAGLYWYNRPQAP